MFFNGSTIEKTMMMGFLFRGFWDRWIVNGIPKATVEELRQRVYRLEEWIQIVQRQAENFEQHAVSALGQRSADEAKCYYRIAGMHYSLIQWMLPEYGTEKREWYKRCKEMHEQADKLVADQIINMVIQVEGKECYGRIRVPANAKGCVIIFNPIDASKEELVQYEDHFAEMGFVSISFDGPGQGETYAMNGYKATRLNWDLFVNHVIDFAASQYPELPLVLFGKSLGGNWAIQGSSHPKVEKTVVISPIVIEGHKFKLPDYLKERLSYIIDGDQESLLADIESFDGKGSILLVHGEQDHLVKDEYMYELYDKLPMKKQLIQYKDEGHCCTYRTDEILKTASEWYVS